MWDGLGIDWEWTWYSQTVHAFTEPDLVGVNAAAVSPQIPVVLMLLPFAVMLAITIALYELVCGHCFWCLESNGHCVHGITLYTWC